jgi:hypothetical protein
LVVLLTLALVSGGARASVPMTFASQGQHHCHEDHAQGAVDNHDADHDTARQHQGQDRPKGHHDEADRSCCCDCLSCVTAIDLNPPLGTSPVLFFAVIHYGEWSGALAGRVLLPDPHPPKRIALT